MPGWLGDKRALLMMPGERYDVIVDFSEFSDGTKITMINTGPDGPFSGLLETDYVPSDGGSSGMIMQFIIDDSLRNPLGDQSTSPYDLVFEELPKNGEPDVVRDLALKELVSDICIDFDEEDPCETVEITECPDEMDEFGQNPSSLGVIGAFLGYNGSRGVDEVTVQYWMDPIQQNPSLGSVELWELWNWTPDAHPIHVHAVHFEVVGRYDVFTGNLISESLAWEEGKKDVVISYPLQITKIKMRFDDAGYFVWHCHILSHEDNEMMLPYCVGEPGVDCPISLFE